MKPISVIVIGTYASYGLYEWNRAEDALKIKGKSIDELAKLFDEIDENKNGSIDLTELEHALKRSNSKDKFSKTQLRAMINRADVDHDGLISKEEFINICEELHTTTHVPHFPALYLPKLLEDMEKKK